MVIIKVYKGAFFCCGLLSQISHIFKSQTLFPLLLVDEEMASFLILKHDSDSQYWSSSMADYHQQVFTSFTQLVWRSVLTPLMGGLATGNSDHVEPKL